MLNAPREEDFVGLSLLPEGPGRSVETTFSLDVLMLAVLVLAVLVLDVLEAVFESEELALEGTFLFTRPASELFL